MVLVALGVAGLAGILRAEGRPAPASRRDRRPDDRDATDAEPTAAGEDEEAASR